jgi:hypothetical protein
LNGKEDPGQPQQKKLKILHVDQFVVAIDVKEFIESGTLTSNTVRFIFQFIIIKLMKRDFLKKGWTYFYPRLGRDDGASSC